ncbi:hypothetical protein B0H21DRAFT_834554 [Amylocystis lapponica]|nr:hypothetical protein B0H21DRAFT_834554 [Amylocystis lapponica]
MASNVPAQTPARRPATPAAPNTEPAPKRARNDKADAPQAAGGTNTRSTFLNPFGGQGRAPANAAPQATASSSNPSTAPRPGALPSGVQSANGAKYLADQIAALRTEMRSVQSTQKTHGVDLEKMTATLENVIAGADEVAETVAMLSQAQHDLLARVWEAEQNLQDFQLEFAQFRDAHTAAGGVDPGGAAAPGGEDKAATKKLHNALQNVVRACLNELMGITKGANLPEPLVAGRFWTHDDPTHPDRLLRPRWDEWNENKLMWLRDVVTKVKTHGSEYSGAMTAQELLGIPLSTIENAIEASYETMKQKYKNAHGPLAKKLEKACMQRRKARKINKATERKAHRGTVPELCDEEYEFIFTWPYQSTDESDHESDAGAIDPDTDNEGDNEVPNIVARTKPWKTRTPTYRNPAIEPHLTRLDRNIQAARRVAAGASKSNQGNTHHPRVRGEPKNKGLPSIRKSTKTAVVKIPRAMIDPEWLGANPEYNLPSLIAVDKDDGEGGEMEVGLDGQGENNENDGNGFEA